MQDGFIFVAFSWLVNAVQHLSLVEYFKKVFVKVFQQMPAGRDELRQKYNIAIDIYLIAKWLFLIFIWWKRYDSVWWFSFTIYMIVTNLHTYFYYHVWKVPTTLNPQGASQRIKRRLVTLLLAVAYSNTCFAYLYDVCLKSDIKWTEGIHHVIAALQLSWGNALAGSYGSATPSSNSVVVLLACQQVLTFIFVAIILSKTIPSD